MKEQFKTWGWYKTYQISEFHYNKITLEDTFPKTMSDDDCIDDLERRIEAQARRKYPHIFHNGHDAMDIYIENHKQFDVAAKKAFGITPTVVEGTLEDQIPSCENLKTLEIYFRIIDKQKDPERKKALFELYDKKHAELTSKETTNA